MWLQTQRLESVLGKAILRKDHPPVAKHGPQPLVEHPMRVFAECQPVLDIVILTRGPRLYMRGIHDRRAIGGEAAEAN